MTDFRPLERSLFFSLTRLLQSALIQFSSFDERLHVSVNHVAAMSPQACTEIQEQYPVKSATGNRQQKGYQPAEWATNAGSRKHSARLDAITMTGGMFARLRRLHLFPPDRVSVRPSVWLFVGDYKRPGRRVIDHRMV